MYHKGKNMTNLLLGVARVARDIPYIEALITHHQRKFTARTHLPNEAHVRVMPMHTCRPYFAGDAAADAFERNQRYTALRQVQRDLYWDNFVWVNPSAKAGVEVPVVPNNNFSHNDPMVNT